MMPAYWCLYKHREFERFTLIDRLPEVVLKLVASMLSREDLNNLRLVSKRWRKVIYYLDRRYRRWYLNKDHLSQTNLVSLVSLHYADVPPELVIEIRCCFSVVDDNLAPLKSSITGFRLFDGKFCKNCLSTYRGLKVFSLQNEESYERPCLEVRRLISQSSSTLVSLDLLRVDLMGFVSLKDNLSALETLSIRSCTNEEGMVKLLDLSKKTLKSLSFYNFTKLDLIAVTESVSSLPVLRELVIIHGDSIPDQMINKSRKTLTTLKMGHIQEPLLDLLEVGKLPKLKNLEISFCQLNVELDCLLSMASNLTNFRLESCYDIGFAECSFSQNLLANVKELCVDVSTNGNLIFNTIPFLGVDNYVLGEVIPVFFRTHSCRQLTKLIFSDVDLARFEEMEKFSFDLPCLKTLEISHDEIVPSKLHCQENSVFGILRSSASTLEELTLKTKVNINRFDVDFPRIKKLELKYLFNTGSIIYTTKELEDLTLILDVDNLAELQGLPAKMPKIKKFSIFTYSTTSKGFMFLWRALESVSDCLEYFKLVLVTPMYSVINVEIPKGIRLPCLRELNIFGFDECYPQLLKLCNNTLQNLNLGSRNTKWVSKVDCRLHVLRRASLTPQLKQDLMKKLKLKCPSSTVFLS